MDFDPRWLDDARDRDRGRNLSRGSGSDTRDRASPDPRDVFTRDLDLPRGREREIVFVRDHYVTQRESEVRTLATVGAFRVVPAGDLRDGDGRPDRRPEEISRWAAEHDLPCRDGHVQFPDARIEYEDRDGILHTLDLEVETVHYRGAHAAAKSASGFSCHGGSSMRVGSRGRGGGSRRSARGVGSTGAGSGNGHGPNPRLAEELLR